MHKWTKDVWIKHAWIPIQEAGEGKENSLSLFSFFC